MSHQMPLYTVEYRENANFFHLLCHEVLVPDREPRSQSITRHEEAYQHPRKTRTVSVPMNPDPNTSIYKSMYVQILSILNMKRN